MLGWLGNRCHLLPRLRFY